MAGCLLCQSENNLPHSLTLSWNHCPGCRSSIREVLFLSKIHVRKYSVLAASPCHSKLTASKPSPLPGIEKLPKFWLSTASVRSRVPPPGPNHFFFSSSVNSTFGGSSSSSSFFSSSSSLTSSSFTSASSIF